MGNSTENAVRCVRLAIERASLGLVDREQLVELIVLAAVAREHVLIVGPPGTAKSQVVRRVAEQLHGRYFEYLIGRFTEPTDIFGTIDLARLREGHVEILTRGMLPEAEIAFLDEVFLGSPAILNTLLGLLNERIFVRGHTRLDCPLRLCVGASNEIPDEPMLAAFADRFLVRVFVQPLADELLETLLDAGWHAEGRAELRRAHLSGAASVTVNVLDELANRAEQMDLSAIRPRIAEAVRTMRKSGIRLTDRRVVRLQRLIAAAASVRGAAAPEARDLWPIVYAIPTAEQQSLGRDVLRELLDPASNETLPNAAESASGSSSSRCLRLCRQVDELLSGERAVDFDVRATALLREITAGFGNDGLPDALEHAKRRLLSSTRAVSNASEFAHDEPQTQA